MYVQYIILYIALRVHTKTIQFHTQTMYMVRSNINTGPGGPSNVFLNLIYIFPTSKVKRSYYLQYFRRSKKISKPLEPPKVV